MVAEKSGRRLARILGVGLAGILSVGSSLADIIVRSRSSDVYYLSMYANHGEGASDGFDPLYDVRWEDVPEPFGQQKWLYPFTLVGGKELETDCRGANSPFSSFNISIKARDTLGESFQADGFQIRFAGISLEYGITDWTYTWRVPAEYMTNGVEYVESGSVTNRLAEGGKTYAFTRGTMKTTVLHDGDVFSTVTLSPVYPSPEMFTWTIVSNHDTNKVQISPGTVSVSSGATVTQNLSNTEYLVDSGRKKILESIVHTP
jgi:hypothetical protein